MDEPITMAPPAPVIDLTEIPLGDLLRGRPIRLTLIAEYTDQPTKHFLATCRREVLTRREGGAQLVQKLEEVFASLKITWP